MKNLDIKEAKKTIRQTEDLQSLEKIKIHFLGRKGIFKKAFAALSKLDQDQRRLSGNRLNQQKREVEKLIKNQRIKLATLKAKIALPKRTTKAAIGLPKFGHYHPITVTEREINNIFRKLGFSIYDGPEIETDEYCFARLNVPKDHPARDMQDTIFIQEPEFLLRTQTSSIEARLLAKEKPPFKAAFPGRVYRNEKVTKSNHFIFHQYQGVAVDHSISLKDLIGVFNILFQHLYGKEVKVRYRCKYYPEVEPGLGLDLVCFNCHGHGCSLCKGAGWIEMGGAGIIHPTVMKMAGIDSRKWRGFAFGLGLDRWVMARYQIKDIRTLLGGNLAYQPYRK